MSCDRASGAEAGGTFPPVVGVSSPKVGVPSQAAAPPPLKGTPSDLPHAGEFGGIPGLFMARLWGVVL